RDRHRRGAVHPARRVDGAGVHRRDAARLRDHHRAQGAAVEVHGRFEVREHPRVRRQEPAVLHDPPRSRRSPEGGARGQGSRSRGVRRWQGAGARRRDLEGRHREGNLGSRYELGDVMARKVLSGLIQASNPLNDENKSVAEIQAAMLEKHLPMIHDAGKKGVQILCLQEIFNGPYFCPGQDKRWYDAAEPVPGPTVEKLRPIAKKYAMAMVVPLYEREQAGVYYNTAAVIDADGSYLGKYRKNHIPQTSGFWEKYFFKPG